jgi:hypothetical protein
VDGHEPTRECTVSSYLRGIAAGCLEVADDPSPTMIETIRGVSRLMDKTIQELERDA